MATREELVAVIKGDISDFKQKMAQVSSTTTSISEKFNKLTTGLFKIGVAGAAAYGALETFKKIAATSSDASDKLDFAVASVTSGLSQMGRQLVNMDFSNFIDNVKNAADVGRDLAERLDDLQDKNRSLSIIESEFGSKIADLRLEASYETNTKEVRISAMKSAIALQKELNEKQLANAKTAKDIAMARLTQESSLSEEQITNFLRQYNDQETLRKQALTWIDEYKKNVKIAGKDYVENLIQRYKDGFKGLSTGPLFESNALLESYARNLMKYGEAADNTINAAVDSLIKLNNVSAQGSQSLKGMQRQLNGLTDNPEQTHGTTLAPKKISPITASLISIRSEVEPLIDLGQRVTRVYETFSDTVSTKLVRAAKEMKTVFVDIGKELEYLAEGALVTFSEGLGAVLVGGSMKSALDNMLLMFADWAGNLGRVIISAGIAIKGIKTWALSNPMAAVGLGIALVATAAAIKGAVNRGPVGGGGGTSSSGGGGGNDSFDLSGKRLLRGGMIIQVDGVITGKGKDLQVILNNEAKRVGL